MKAEWVGQGCPTLLHLLRSKEQLYHANFAILLEIFCELRYSTCTVRNAVLDVHTELCERLCVAFGHEDGVVAEAFGALLLGGNGSAYYALE